MSLLQHNIDMVEKEVQDLLNRYAKKIEKEQKYLKQAHENIKKGEKCWKKYQKLKQKQQKMVLNHEKMELLFEQQIKSSQRHIDQLQKLNDIKSIKFVLI